MRDIGNGAIVNIAPRFPHGTAIPAGRPYGAFTRQAGITLIRLDLVPERRNRAVARGPRTGLKAPSISLSPQHFGTSA
jgi:hypothetical protein